MELIILIIIILTFVYFWNKRKKNKITVPFNQIPHIQKDVTKEIKTETKNLKKTWGSFEVVGFHHLSEEIKLIVWKELKVGDELSLIPDLRNTYDSNAIKVNFKDKQIGWVPKKLRRKKEIFDLLIEKSQLK